MANDNIKIRVTKAYLVEVTDKDGYLLYMDDYGKQVSASDWCFGNRQEALALGEQLKKMVLEKGAEK